jgi:4Fe-4S ferredoxin
MPNQCKAKTAGEIGPAIDPNKCEGKENCVRVCPYDVFEVVRMSDELYSSLALKGRLEAFIHGKKTAATPNVDKCMNCGLCVAACPENAIRLERFEG